MEVDIGDGILVRCILPGRQGGGDWGVPPLVQAWTPMGYGNESGGTEIFTVLVKMGCQSMPEHLQIGDREGGWQ